LPFKCNLQRYGEVEEWLLPQSFVPAATVWKTSDTFVKGGLEQDYSVVGLCRLNQVDP
jgi:hypothetical protein